MEQQISHNTSVMTLLQAVTILVGGATKKNNFEASFASMFCSGRLSLHLHNTCQATDKSKYECNDTTTSCDHFGWWSH